MLDRSRLAALLMSGDNGYKRRGGETHYEYGQQWRAEDLSEVQVSLRRKRANAEADRILANESWKLPDLGVSFADELLDPPTPVRQVVQGILPEGISMMAAQFKAGKTTLGLNLASSLVSGEDFLDWFELEQLAGNVGYWNMEVDRSQMFEWQERLIKKHPEKMFTAHLRGQRMDLLYDLTAEHTVEWLRSNDIEVWFLDPMGRMLDEENSSAAFNKWFQRLESIVSEAGVRAVLIIHHSGHAGMGMDDAMPRARGASAMMGNTDCNWSYRHAGGLGEMPPDNRRYLSAYGRGVELWPELTLEFDYDDGKLYTVDNTSGRHGDKIERGIERVIEAIREAGNGELNNSDLRNSITGTAADKSAFIKAALRSGRIEISKKKGSKSEFYSLT
jgi:hypothetical protein